MNGRSRSAACGLLAIVLSLSACKSSTQPGIDPPELPIFGQCEAVSPAGGLSYSSATQSYTFRTSGGGTIIIDLSSSITLSHDEYDGFAIELWSLGQEVTTAQHENLNGKHIKDRLQSRRTIIFPDGAKLTMVADGSTEPLTAAAIVDGPEGHFINARCNVPEYSGLDAALAEELDLNMADGEASAFRFTDEGLIWENLYEESAAGSRTDSIYPLGEIKRSNPNQVLDYFDDPRIGAT